MHLKLRFILLSVLTSYAVLPVASRPQLMRVAQVGLVGGALVNAVEALVGKVGRETLFKKGFRARYKADKRVRRRVAVILGRLGVSTAAIAAALALGLVKRPVDKTNLPAHPIAIDPAAPGGGFSDAHARARVDSPEVASGPPLAGDGRPRSPFMHVGSGDTPDTSQDEAFALALQQDQDRDNPPMPSVALPAEAATAFQSSCAAVPDNWLLQQKVELDSLFSGLNEDNAKTGQLMRIEAIIQRLPSGLLKEHYTKQLSNSREVLSSCLRADASQRLQDAGNTSYAAGVHENLASTHLERLFNPTVDQDGTYATYDFNGNVGTISVLFNTVRQEEGEVMFAQVKTSLQRYLQKFAQNFNSPTIQALQGLLRLPFHPVTLSDSAGTSVAIAASGASTPASTPAMSAPVPEEAATAPTPDSEADQSLEEKLAACRELITQCLAGGGDATAWINGLASLKTLLEQNLSKQEVGLFLGFLCKHKKDLEKKLGSLMNSLKMNDPLWLNIHPVRALLARVAPK